MNPHVQSHSLEDSLSRSTQKLHELQREDGHFVFEFEADATIPSEYVLLVHYLGEEANPELERKITRYLLRIQNPDGGWPLFTGGMFDMSASVKAYFALKMMGVDTESEPMQRARLLIRARGGAEASNVFTRILLALYGQLTWNAVPVMPVEIMLLPHWFPFHIYKISYWGRTVMVPLLVLQTLRPRACNLRGVRVDELFHQPPETIGMPGRAPHQHRGWFRFFAVVDNILRWVTPHFSITWRKTALRAAETFVRERLNSEDGLGAIFPAMANSVMMLDALGVSRESVEYQEARRSIEKLLVVKQEEAYCQPCVSPVWDTALAAHSLLETGEMAAAKRALDWLLPRQVCDVRGDFVATRPQAQPGGWAFQYANPHYPDLDDTAVVVMAMDRLRKQRDAIGTLYDHAIERARAWILPMQSKNGGWASFDADNTATYLNNIPFSDHGALLDPPTSDVTARCSSMLAQLGYAEDRSAIARGVDFLLREQREDGSWFGRWGMNYIYGTWSTCCALRAAGLAADSEPLARAAAWLRRIQNADGGWGEGGDSYRLEYAGYEPFPSMPSQTSWALLALMALGQERSDEVARGIACLQATQKPDGTWEDRFHNAPGFPRIFYLRYVGYAQYFPQWALARYRALHRSNQPNHYGL